MISVPRLTSSASLKRFVVVLFSASRHAFDIIEQNKFNKEKEIKTENKSLWDIEDIIKQLALDGYDKIGLFETSKYLKISQDKVLECFIYLSERDYPKLNIKILITCPIHREVLYSYDFNKGLNQIQPQYYCHYCEDIIDVNAEYVYLQFLIDKNYLKFNNFSLTPHPGRLHFQKINPTH